MIVRVVSFEIAEGNEQEFRRLGQEEVVATNLRFGALQCHILEPISGSRRFGIISMWPALETLNAMRANPEYQDLLARARSLMTGPLGDDVYQTLPT